MTSRPACIIVTGRPGAGKTTLAKMLGERLWLPIVSRDSIKEGYVSTRGVKHDDLPNDTNAVVTSLFFEIVKQHLAGGVSIVIEAAFQHEMWASKMPRLIELASPLIVVCAVDGEVASRRQVERGLGDPGREFFHGDRPVEVYRESGVITPADSYRVPEFDLPTLQVSTDAGYSPGIDTIVMRIRASVSAMRAGPA